MPAHQAHSGDAPWTHVSSATPSHSTGKRGSAGGQGPVTGALLHQQEQMLEGPRPGAEPVTCPACPAQVLLSCQEPELAAARHRAASPHVDGEGPPAIYLPSTRSPQDSQ